MDVTNTSSKQQATPETRRTPRRASALRAEEHIHDALVGVRGNATQRRAQSVAAGRLLWCHTGGTNETKQLSLFICYLTFMHIQFQRPLVYTRHPNIVAYTAVKQ
jgi:hypothetical protein